MLKGYELSRLSAPVLPPKQIKKPFREEAKNGDQLIYRKVYGTDDTDAEMIADLWVGVPDYVIILENCTMG